MLLAGTEHDLQLPEFRLLDPQVIDEVDLDPMMPRASLEMMRSGVGFQKYPPTST